MRGASCREAIAVRGRREMPARERGHDALVASTAAAAGMPSPPAASLARARIAARAGARRLDLPAVGERQFRRRASPVSLYPCGGRRRHGWRGAPGTVECGRMDAAGAYRRRYRGRARRGEGRPANRNIDRRGLTDRLARHPLQRAERGFEGEGRLRARPWARPLRGRGSRWSRPPHPALTPARKTGFETGDHRAKRIVGGVGNGWPRHLGGLQPGLFARNGIFGRKVGEYQLVRLRPHRVRLATGPSTTASSARFPFSGPSPPAGRSRPARIGGRGASSGCRSTRRRRVSTTSPSSSSLAMIGRRTNAAAQRRQPGRFGLRDQQRDEAGKDGGDGRHPERKRQPAGIADRRHEKIGKAVEIQVPADTRDPRHRHHRREQEGQRSSADHRRQRGRSTRSSAVQMALRGFRWSRPYRPNPCGPSRPSCIIDPRRPSGDAAQQSLVNRLVT